MDKNKYKLFKALDKNEYLYPNQIRKLFPNYCDEEICRFLMELRHNELIRLDRKYNILSKSKDLKDIKLRKELYQNRIYDICDICITSKARDMLSKYENDKIQFKNNEKKDKSAKIISIIGLIISFLALVLSLFAVIIQYQNL